MQCPCGTQEVGGGEHQLGPILTVPAFNTKYEDGELALDLEVFNPVEKTELAVNKNELVIKTPAANEEEEQTFLRELSSADSALGSSIREPISEEPAMNIQVYLREKPDYPQTGTFLRHVGEITPQQIIEKDGVQEFCDSGALSGRPLHAYYDHARVSSTRMLKHNCDVHIMCVRQPASQAVVMTIYPRDGC